MEEMEEMVEMSAEEIYCRYLLPIEIEELENARRNVRYFSLIAYAYAVYSLGFALFSLRNIAPSAYTAYDISSFINFGIIVVFTTLIMTLKSRVAAVFLLVFLFLGGILFACISGLMGTKISLSFYVGIVFVIILCYLISSIFNYQKLWKKAYKKWKEDYE